eukprot:m.35534 g.35534  ORF g.35534 m.35534 type:complete len:926 (+) comp6610_c0_seq1:210-2987(+)
MSIAQKYGTWEDVYDYLSQAGVLPKTLDKDLIELVNSLRDGVALCKLAQMLSETPIQFNEEASLQFLCMENIHTFQTFCVSLGVKEEDLFQDDDLFHAVSFENIVKTLSLLSAMHASTSKGLKPFPESAIPVLISEDVYENLSNIIENMSPSTQYGSIYGNHKKKKALSFSEGNIFDETEIVADDVYASIVRDKKRVKVPSNKLQCRFDELVGNEEKFIGSLEVMNAAYRLPLQAFFLKNGGLNIDVSPVFKFLDTIRSLHARILQDLRGRNGMQCGTFVRFRDELIIYADYCSNIPLAYDIVKAMESHKLLGPALIKMRDDSGQRFFLRELINVPMQHVLRYPLLLKELVKCSNPPHELLSEAYKTSQDIAKHVNESKFDADNQQYVQKVAAGLKDYFTTTDDFGKRRSSLDDLGRYFSDGDVKLRLLQAQKPSNRYIFLFQRTLLVCKARRTGYHFYFEIPIREFMIGSEIVKGYRVPAITLTSMAPLSSGFNCVLLFKTDVQREHWMDSFLHAKELTQMENLASPTETSHEYEPCSFEDGATCTNCSFLLWGKLNQGVKCKHCNVQVHRECVELYQHQCAKKTSAMTPGKKTVRRKPSRDASIETASVGDLLVAIHNFKNHKAAQDGDLRFKKGDLVRIVSMPEKHWWIGKQEDSGAKGTFPVSFFKKVDVQEMKMGRRVSTGPIMRRPIKILDTSTSHEPTPTRSRVSTGSIGMTLPNQTDPIKHRSSTALPSLPPKHTVVDGAPPPITSHQKEKSDIWYMGPMSRLHAQEHLLMADDGSYCVRESVTTPGNYVITIKCNPTIRHLKVQSSSNGYFLGVKNKFSSIPALVEYFQIHSLAIHFPEVDYSLKYPCGTKKFPNVHVYRAMYPFNAAETSELSFRKGELIEVFDPSQGEDWWEGRIGDKIGFLPANFVEPMETEC